MREENPLRPIATWARFTKTREAARELAAMEKKPDTWRTRLRVATETLKRGESMKPLMFPSAKDVGTLLRCYQQADNHTLLAVMNEATKVTEKAVSR